MSPRPTFDKELELLNSNLIKMGTLIEIAIDGSIDALLNRNKEKAKAIIQNDCQIDEIEKSIESQCLGLLLRQQPVATDLRAISTALKMITDMERIGDQAADIAEISLFLGELSIVDLEEHLPLMSKITCEMVHSSIDSFVKKDLVLACETKDKDDQVDSLFNTIKNDLKNYILNDNTNSDQAIDVLMIAKYLERIADHAVNICEWVEFYATGEHKNYRIL